MHQALTVREVLSNVFQGLYQCDLFGCALVCPDWTDVALDTLWREVDLFAIPLPFPNGGSNSREFSVGFSRPIKLEDWERFEWYARRIRKLSLPFHWFDDPPESLFSELALKRPQSALLPNLRRLEISPTSAKTLSFPLVFMDESVTELLFHVPPRRSDDYDDLSEYVHDFFWEVSKRMPRLRCLDLRSAEMDEGANISWEWIMEEFLSSSETLESFTCFPYFLSASILRALSRLPNLRIVRMEWGTGFGHFSRRSGVRFDERHFGESFPNLVELSFCATFINAMDMMELDIATKLEALHLHSPQSESADSIHRLLLVLTRKHSKLRKLRLSSIGSTVNNRLNLPDGGDYINDSTLSPLRKFSDLTEFEITYHRQLHIYGNTIKEILSCLPRLEVLSLCSDPLRDEHPILTCSILPIIAECCPKLRRLSLYVNTRIHESSSPSRFLSLERIEFGASPLAEENISDFALSLSDVLPATCEVGSLCDIRWRRFIDSKLLRDGLETLNKDWKNWHELSKILALLLKARARECLRSKASPQC